LPSIQGKEIKLAWKKSDGAFFRGYVAEEGELDGEYLVTGLRWQITDNTP
jgi:hypothetical protein